MDDLKRRVWLIGAAGVAVAAGMGVAWKSSRSQAAAALWPMNFDQPGGETLAMTHYRDRPLLLNFWASWCPPCVREMPLLDAFQHDHADQHWQVIGLAVDSLESVRHFLADRPVSYPIGIAGMSGVELAQHLGNSQQALPYTVLIGSNGQVADRKLGQINAGELQTWAKAIR